MTLGTGSGRAAIDYLPEGTGRACPAHPLQAAAVTHIVRRLPNIPPGTASSAMQRKKIPGTVRRKIIARAWDGETFAHIARDLGLSRHTVSTIAMREGGFPTMAEVTELQHDAICAAYQESGSMANVAKRFALSEQSVSNTLHARGVRKRKSRRSQG